MLLRPRWELKSPINLQDPHCQGHFNVISSYILSLELSDLGGDWAGDGEGDQRHRLCLRKGGWSRVRVLGDAEKKGKKVSWWGKIRN